MLRYIAVLAICVAGTTAQVICYGECPSVTVQPQFDIRRYMGKWYEMEKFFAMFELGQSCITADYSLQTDGTVRVVNRGLTPIRRYKVAVGDAIVTDPNNRAKLAVRFNQYMPRGDYWVLETDYDTYTVVWSCKKAASWIPFHTKFAWILTRGQAGISEYKKSQIYDRLASVGIDTSRFSRTTQTNCP